jgi:hypothetical protein
MYGPLNFRRLRQHRNKNILANLIGAIAIPRHKFSAAGSNHLARNFHALTLSAGLSLFHSASTSSCGW